MYLTQTQKRIDSYFSITTIRRKLSRKTKNRIAKQKQVNRGDKESKYFLLSKINIQTKVKIQISTSLLKLLILL
jgi:hypothetical protein